MQQLGLNNVHCVVISRVQMLLYVLKLCLIRVAKNTSRITTPAETDTQMPTRENAVGARPLIALFDV